MSANDLFSAADRLIVLADSLENELTTSRLNPIYQAAERIGKAWSQSNIGYQSSIYYAEFDLPPPDAHFSSEWGFTTLHTIRTTTGDWQEFSFDDVVAEIYRRAGNPNIDDLDASALAVRREFKSLKESVVSILTQAASEAADPYITRMLAEASGEEVITAGANSRHSFCPTVHTSPGTHWR